MYRVFNYILYERDLSEQESISLKAFVINIFQLIKNSTKSIKKRILKLFNEKDMNAKCDEFVFFSRCHEGI